ncbi:MAG: helix-turn-helix domain-containing protein [Clostridiales bacterium]|nr:helix-turn-helix domain-containing protein [Clostridiales bacterium]
MSTFGERLKAVRTEKGMTQEEFATLLGTSKQVISRYEKNQRTPKITAVHNYAKKLGIDPIYLIDDDTAPLPANLLPMPRMKKFPLIGSIACGTPILAQENIEDMIEMPEDIQADFVLRCTGDSMIGARIQDGDLVFIRKQPMVENGEIAAVLIDDEATLKRVYYEEGRQLTLVAENPAYRPLVYTGEQLNEVRIIGRAVSFLSTL